MNKLSFVLVGLVVMLSGMVAATAYVSNNQLAFVKAQPTLILTIDFGNAFPGTDVTESFTIASLTGQGYTYDLILASALPAEDMSLHVKVWKDPAEDPETEPDGTIDGRIADFTGAGSFTSPNDLSDKWFVTFYVPDVTLPAGTVLEYGCTISIEPHIDFPTTPVE